MSFSDILKAIDHYNSSTQTEITSLGTSEIGTLIKNPCIQMNIDEYKNNFHEIISKLSDFDPSHPYRYYSNRISDKIEKEFHFEDNYAKDAMEILENASKLIQQHTEIIIENLDNAKQFEKNHNGIEILLTKYSNLCTKIQNAILNINGSEDLIKPESINLATELNIKYNIRKSPFKYYTSMFRYLSLTRYKEILSKAIKKYNEDCHRANIQVPSPVIRPAEINIELERLAHINNIVYDVDEYDGQKFFFSCERVFIEAFNTFSEVEPGKTLPNLFIEKDLKAHVNAASLHNNKDERVLKYIKLLNSDNCKEVDSFLNESLLIHPYRSAFPRDRARCILRLRFVHCRKLYQDIIKNVIQISPKEETPSYLKIMFDHIIVNATHELNSSQSNCDYDSIIESLLSRFNYYLDEKVAFSHLLDEIYQVTRSEKILRAKTNLNIMQPEFSTGMCIGPLISLELERDVFNLWRRVALSLKESLTLYLKRMPLISNCETPYIELANIGNFILESQAVVSELCQTLNISYDHFNIYVSYAVFSQYLEDIAASDLLFFDPSFPGTFKGIDTTEFTPIFNNALLDTESINHTDLESAKDHFVKVKYIIKMQSILRKQILIGYNRFVADFSFDLPNLKNLFITQRRALYCQLVKTRFERFKQVSLSIESFLGSSGDGFFITTPDKAEDSGNSQDLTETIRKMIPSFEKSSNYESVFELSGIDFGNLEATKEAAIRHSIKLELAWIVANERIFFSTTHEIQPFSIEGKMFDDGSLKPFIVALPSECLAYETNNDTLWELLKFASARIRLMYFSQFMQSISKPRRVLVEALISKTTRFETASLSPLVRDASETSDPKAIAEMFQLFARYRETILVTAIVKIVWDETLSGSNPDLIDSYRGAFADTRVPTIAGLFFNIYRYVPRYFVQYLPHLSEAARPGLWNNIAVVQTIAEETCLSTPIEKRTMENCTAMLEFLRSIILSMGYILLKNEENYVSINPEYCIKEITYDKYMTFKSDYTTKIEAPANHIAVGHEGSFERAIYRATIKILIEQNESMILEQILKEINKNYDDTMNEITTANSIVPSSMKPDYYSKRNHIAQLRIPYIPVPGDAQNQFNQEVTYIRLRFIRAVYDSLHMKNNETLEIETSKLTENLTKISPMFDFFFEKTPEKQTATWRQYLQNIQNKHTESDEDQRLLDMAIKDIQNRFSYQLSIVLARTQIKKIQELNALRKIEYEQTRAHAREEKRFTRQLTKEHLDLVSDLKVQIHKTRNLFDYKRKQFFASMKNTINGVLSDKDGFSQTFSHAGKVPDPMPYIEADHINDESSDDEIPPKEPEHKVAEPPKPVEPAPKVEIPTVEENKPETESTRNEQPTSTNEEDIEDVKQVNEEEPKGEIEDGKDTKQAIEEEPKDEIVDGKSIKQITEEEPKGEIEDGKANEDSENQSQNRIEEPRPEDNIKPEEPKVEVIQPPSLPVPAPPSASRAKAPRTKSKQELTPERRLEQEREQIEEMRKLCIKERISRALLNIALNKQYSRQIDKEAVDKKKLSTLLWQSRHETETVQRQIEADLQEAYKQLSAVEIQVENLREQLEKEKHLTAQQQHLKAVLMGRQDQLIHRLKAFENSDEVNVSQLVEDIENAKYELDDLSEETELFDEQVELSIREPMKEIDRVKRRITEVRTASARMRVRTQKEPEPTQMHENEALRKENESLRLKIAELESQIGVSSSAPKTAVPKEGKTSKRGPQSARRAIVKPKAPRASTGVLRFM